MQANVAQQIQQDELQQQCPHYRIKTVYSTSECRQITKATARQCDDCQLIFD